VKTYKKLYPRICAWETLEIAYRHARKGKRRAYLPERMTFADVDVYDGHRLQAGNVVEGPALVERIDTTIFVTRVFVAGIDAHGSCRLARREGQA